MSVSQEGGSMTPEKTALIGLLNKVPAEARLKLLEATAKIAGKKNCRSNGKDHGASNVPPNGKTFPPT